MVGVKLTPWFKYPPGIARDCRVVANERHAKAHRSTPPGRGGVVVAPTSKRDYVRIKWDGCVKDDAVHLNFFDVVGAEK